MMIKNKLFGYVIKKFNQINVIHGLKYYNLVTGLKLNNYTCVTFIAKAAHCNINDFEVSIILGFDWPQLEVLSFRKFDIKQIKIIWQYQQSSKLLKRVGHH